MRNFKIAIALYIAGVILTFGHEAAKFEAEAKMRGEEWKVSQAGPKALMVSLIWPGYWPAKASWMLFDLYYSGERSYHCG